MGYKVNIEIYAHILNLNGIRLTNKSGNGYISIYKLNS